MNIIIYKAPFHWAITVAVIAPVTDSGTVRKHIEQFLRTIMDGDIDLRFTTFYEEQLHSVVLDTHEDADKTRDLIEKKMRRLSRGKPKFKLIGVSVGRWTGVLDND